jgi:hypothetical protein
VRCAVLLRRTNAGRGGRGGARLACAARRAGSQSGPLRREVPGIYGHPITCKASNRNGGRAGTRTPGPPTSESLKQTFQLNVSLNGWNSIMPSAGSDSLKSPPRPQARPWSLILRSEWRFERIVGHSYIDKKRRSGKLLLPGRFKPADPYWGPRSNEGVKVRWIGAHFLFSFELSYRRLPLKPCLDGSSRLVLRFSQNFLKSPPLLCKMVACAPDGPAAPAQWIGQKLAG